MGKYANEFMQCHIKVSQQITGISPMSYIYAFGEGTEGSSAFFFLRLFAPYLFLCVSEEPLCQINSFSTVWCVASCVAELT